jgi:hypothetical protein
MSLGVKCLYLTLNKNDIQHKYHDLFIAMLIVIMLKVIELSVVMLNVVVPLTKPILYCILIVLPRFILGALYSTTVALFRSHTTHFRMITLLPRYISHILTPRGKNHQFLIEI